MRSQKAFTDDDLIDAVEAALEETDRDRVTTEEIAEHCWPQKESLRTRLRELVKDDRLVESVSYVNPPAKAYQLPDGDQR